MSKHLALALMALLTATAIVFFAASGTSYVDKDISAALWLYLLGGYEFWRVHKKSPLWRQPQLRGKRKKPIKRISRNGGKVNGEYF